MSEELKSAQGEFFKGGMNIDHYKEKIEAAKPEVEAAEEEIETLDDLGAEKKKDEVDVEKEVDIENLEVDTKKEEKKEAKSDKNWRDSYKETDEYKSELKKQDLELYEAKMKELQEIENDEAYKIIKEARAKGVNPLDYIKELAENNVSKLTPEDLYMKKIEKYKDKLTEDQIEEALDKFNSMSAIEQFEATEGIRAELEAAQKEKLSRFESKKEEVPQDVINNIKKFEVELDSLFNKLNGKIYKGVKYTPTLLSKIEKAIMDGLISPKAYIREDGTFDPVEALEAVQGLKSFRGLMKKNEIETAASQAREEVLKDKSNVSKGVRTTGMPKSSDSQAELKLAQKQFFNK
jgi:hypothetical protein